MIKTFFPSEKQVPTQSSLAPDSDKDTQPASLSASSPGTALTEVSTTPSSPTERGPPILPLSPALPVFFTPFNQGNPPAETERKEAEPIPHSLPPSEPQQIPDNTHVPAIFAVDNTTHDDSMATMAQNPTHAGTVQDQDHLHDQDDSYLADRAGGLSLAEQGQSDGYDRDVNDIANDRKSMSNGGTAATFGGGQYDEEPQYDGDTRDGRVKDDDMMESPYDNYPNGEQPHETRPS